MDSVDSFTERLLQRNEARKQYKSIKENETPDFVAKRLALVEEQQIMSLGNINEVQEKSLKRSCEDLTDVSLKRQCVEQNEGSSKQWPPKRYGNEDQEKENFSLQKDCEEPFLPLKSSFNSKGLATVQTTAPRFINSALTSQAKEAEDIKNPVLKSFKAIDDKSKYIKTVDVFGDNKCAVNKSVKNLVKLFGSEQAAGSLNKSTDPAELPLSARRALFERGFQGKGDKLKEHSFVPKLSVAQRAALFENASQKNSTLLPNNKSDNIITSPELSPCKPREIANVDSESSPSRSVPVPEEPVVTKKSKLYNIITSPELSPCKPREIANVDSESSPSRSVPVPEEPVVTKKMSPRSPSPLKGLNTDTHAVEPTSLAKVSSEVDMNKSDVQSDEMAASRNSNLVDDCEELSAPVRSGNNNFEEEPSDKHETPESEMYLSEDVQEDYESETESKCEKQSESEFNSIEITEEEFCEFDSEKDSPAEENVFKSPKGFPFTSKTCDAKFKSSTMKSPVVNQNMQSWSEDNYVENSCDVISLSDGSSYSESSVSTDFRTAETHPSYASNNSSVGSSYDPESSNESVENFTKSSCGSNSDTPLLYTLSIYRKQQGARTPPPPKTMMHKKQTSSPSPDIQTDAIQKQIKYFQQEIDKQQAIIGQTSQALNLCQVTAEFSGSSEQVEGERHLLIATQKQKALLNELQRLKTCGAESVCDGTGTLTISDLQLPLKKEFLAAQLEGKINDAVHWFLCLIHYGTQVIVTQMISTDNVSNGALHFTNHIKLQNLHPNFSILFEVYALQTKRERLAHEKKYHIKRDKSTLRLTTKGRKSDKLLVPEINSPGGPNAVRASSFGVVGSTRFAIQNCNKNCFTLDAVPSTSPLDGVLRVHLHLHAEQKVMEKGFLTMFEDVSGFGAWHRRWCALNAQHLTYWKYPEDEEKKVPIGCIDLKHCVTTQIKPVSRNICARTNTFQLVTVRPQTKEDKNTLISQCANTLTTTKHLLSADTKEERFLWCNKLNEALTNTRKWDPHALCPVETNQD